MLREYETPSLGRRVARALLAAGPVPTGAERYGGAVALVAVASLAAYLAPVELAPFRVLFLITAVTVAALRGGTGPGLLSVLFSAVLYRVLVGPRPVPWPEGPAWLPSVAFFVGFAALDVWVASSLGSAFRQSHARRRRAEARAGEDRVVARLGVKALAETDLDALLEETLAAVQEGLRCDSVALLQLAPEGDAFIVRKVSGLGRGLTGRRVGGDDTKLALETLRRREVVTVEDLSAQPEFASSLLVQHGIESSVVSPIGAPGPRGKPFGVLGAHWRARHLFTGEETALVQSAANVVGTALVRIQSEERVRDHLGFLRAIAASLAEGVYVLDRDGRATFVNAAATRMLGWSEEELLGRPVHDLIHGRGPDGAPRPESSCPVLEVVRTGQPTRSQDDVFTRRDGTVFPVAYTASPLWRGGEVAGVVCAFQDFTEHVRAERAERFLADASRQLALSIEWEETLTRIARLAVPVLGDWCLVVLVGPDGRPRSVAAEAADPARSDAARALLEDYPIELAAEHGVGRILRTGAPELIPDVGFEAFVGAGQGGAALRRREVLSRIGLTSYIGAPLEVGGRILGALGFGISGGPRRYGPEDLALACELARRCAVALDNANLYRTAQEATRAREEVLAVVSHDLKAPLGALQLGAQLVARMAPPGAQGDELRRAATTVRRSADRMGRLIHDLVDIASIDAGRLSVRTATHDAGAIAREALDAVGPVAVERRVALKLGVGRAAAVECDRDRVLQVLSNLLANALHVTESGGEVRLEVAASRGEVVFTVADTGPGVPPDDQAHLFERWYRGRRTTYAGSGLGLAIARGIVEAHGGRIWVRSEPGQGSAFSFALREGAGAPEPTLTPVPR